MTDWILIGITFIYVVATIFISVYNNRSSIATREMLAESKRQFEEENRPHITVELTYEKRAFYSIRLTNHGKQAAFNVHVELQQAFIDSIKEEKIRTLLEKQKGRERIIGVGQHYDLYIGTNRYLSNNEKSPVAGTVLYQNGTKLFEQPFFIDIAKYGTFFSVNSEMEDLIKRMDEQNKELKRIANTLDKIYLASVKDEDNNIEY